MSTKSAKCMAGQQKRRTRAEQNHTAVNGVGSEGPSGRFWMQRIEPAGAALLSQRLGPCTLVVKNHGPNNVRLVAEHGDLMDLGPGAVRATYAYGTVAVQNTGEASAIIEFDFVPIK